MTEDGMAVEIGRLAGRVGRPRRRGFPYPPQWWGEKYLGTVFDFGAAAIKGETDLTEQVETINAVLKEWFGRKNAG